jgi:hypothetical protein
MPDDLALDAPPLAPDPPARSVGKLIVTGVLVAAILSVAGVFIFRAATGPDPVAARVPASVSAYAQVTLQPSIAQKRLLRDLVDQLPGGRDRVEASLDAILERVFEPVDADVDVDEVRAWIGDQVAVSTWSPDDGSPMPVLVAHAKDVELARATVDAINLGDDAVASLDAGFVTIGRFDAGTLDRFKEAVAAAPLSRDKPFKAARARVGGDGVLLIRAELDDVASALRSISLPGGRSIPRASIPEGNTVAGAQFVDDGVKISFAEESMLVDRPLPETDDLALLHELAEHAHGAIGFNDLASLLREAIALAPPEAISSFESRYGLDIEEDVLSWLGDEVAFRVVNFGDDEHHATIAVESSDEEAMRSFVQTVRGFLAIAPPEGVLVSGSEDDTFHVRFGEFVADIVLDGSRLTIEMSSHNVSTTNDEAPALIGLPEMASFAGAVNVEVIEEETPFGGLLAETGPLGVYGRALHTIGIAATRGESGPVFSIILLFKGAA